MSLDREDSMSPCSGPPTHSQPGSRKGTSHVSHATLASPPTTDQGVAMSSCRLPASSPGPPSSSAISSPLSPAADHLAAHIQPASSTPLRKRPQLPPPFPSVPKKPSFNTRQYASPASRSPPLPATPMGQWHSKSSSSPAPSPLSAGPVSKFQAALAGGIKLKRAFVNRRKKPEDDSQSLGATAMGAQNNGRQLVQEQRGYHIRVDSCAPMLPSNPLSSSKPAALNLSNSTAMMAADQLPLLSPPPPPPPPKSPLLLLRQHEAKGASSTSLVLNQPVTSGASSEPRTPIIPLGPGITSTVKLVCTSEEMEQGPSGTRSMGNTEDGEANTGHQHPRERPKEADMARWEVINAADTKEARRKSDSTVSYQTIRPGTTSNRTSRPVSMAESLRSNNTVKPVRISALITELDFTMLEEDDETCKDAAQETGPGSSPSTIVAASQRASLEASPKTKSRRSLSLNLGSYAIRNVQPPPSASHHHTTLSLAEIKYPSYSMTEGMPPPMLSSVPSPAKELPKITGPSTAAQIGALPSPRSQTTTTQTSRGKLSSWTNPPPSERRLPAFPPQMPPPSTGPMTAPTYTPQNLRAISMTSSLAPAAGQAIRDAVGRMRRAIGISSNSSTSLLNSGYSSSASATSDGHPLTRTNSNQSSALSHGQSPLSWGKRRTPDAPSGAWSVASSTSDFDHTGASQAPVLGMMLRAPYKGPGLVFGRDLKSAVRNTAVAVRQSGGGDGDPGKALEERALPAVVVRCAQHILVRGIQEEGLFRVNGRSKHIIAIRAEFDKGADYHMAACEPVDLDPHAVASVFKAYFRELPEPVLTAALLPFFEKVVEREMNIDVELKSGFAPKPSARGPGLPSGPRPGNATPHGVKKPPSLSTLALPSFKDMTPPSNSLVKAIRALTAQLPEENRDLLRTLVDVMNATAKNDKATKMPLANLVLVLCPTLQMTPPLLRILCEVPEIWDEVEISSEEVITTKRGSMVVARTASSSSGGYSDAAEGVDESESLYSNGRTSEDQPASVSDYQASVEDSIDPPEAVPRSRPTRLNREPLSTVYLDAECGSSSASSLPQPLSIAAGSNASLASSKYPNIPTPSSTPPMTSSAESLATPASSSGQPSVPHLPIEDTRKFGAEQEVVVAPEYINSETAPHTDTIRFPTLPASPPAASVPSTPVKRRSIPLLSLPHITTGLSPPPSSLFAQHSPATSARSSASLPRKYQTRKPSLQIFLSAKGSSSSLKGISKSSISSPIMNFDSTPAPQSASDSSVSTPLSAVTAPQGGAFPIPPVIDTPLEGSPFGLGMGIQITPPTTAGLEADPHYRDDEDAMTVETSKAGTPIADRNRVTSPSSSVLAVSFSSRTNTVRSSPSPLAISSSTSSSTSSNHLGFLDGELRSEDDWTHSVLMAADIESEQ